MIVDSEQTNTTAGLVSLIMAAWRPHHGWLRAAVASALEQSGCELELIVVDDGSPKPVAELLADVHDDRLRILRVEHAGESHARNAGFAASRGEWIRYVDCDDILEPDSTAHLLELAAGGAVIAYGATVWCDEEMKPVSKVVCDIQGRATMECLFDRFPVGMPALLFPRWVVERVGDWDEEIAICQDWDFTLRALEMAPVRGDDRTVLRYRRHAGGASWLDTPESIRLSEAGMRRVVDRYLERNPEHRETSVEARARATVELVLARSHRTAYIAHLGRAARGDRVGVAREIGTFARVMVSQGRALIRRTLAMRTP